MKKILLSIIFLFITIVHSQTIALQSFATGLSSPVSIANAGDSRLFVVQQGGLIRIINANGTINATPFLNLSTIISSGSERGLLGLAFHPNYATNGYFFVNYTNTSGNTVIARYSVNSTNPNIANTTGTILMTINQPYSNHNGGNIMFGPDGYLYIGMGDGGLGGDPQGYAQNLTVPATNASRVFLGKMLRIDVNSDTAPYYTIPSTNPFIGQTGKEEIWAYGLRNPWKFSFDSQTGDLWIADVGQDVVEEVDKVVAPLPDTGLNFGWRCYEGNTSFNTSGCPLQSTMVSPVATTSHNAGNCSITGGFVYRGTTYPNLQGKYLFSDYCNSRIGVINSTNSLTFTTPFSGNNFVCFGEDVNGELYIGSIGGTIYRITDTSLANESFSSEAITIYPNPAKDKIFINNNSNNLVVFATIFDLTGKKIFSKNSNLNEIDVTAIDKGIYLLELTTNQGTTITKKLIIE